MTWESKSSESKQANFVLSYFLKKKKKQESRFNLSAEKSLNLIQ